MDFAVLEAKEAYRNWINLGLKNFFVSREVADGLSVQRAQESEISAGRTRPSSMGGTESVTGRRTGRRPDGSVARRDFKADNSVGGGQPRGMGEPGRRSGTVSGSGLSMAPEGPGEAPGVRAGSGPGDEPDWKAVWRRYRPKLSAPVKTVWTYWNLGNDMGGKRDPKRKELFANMIKALAWPRGSIGFWPVSFQHRGKLLPRRELFVKGLRESGAHTVICFGQRAFNVLFPDEIFDYKTMTIGDVTVIVVPGPGPMLSADCADAKRSVWRTLAAYKP